MAVTTRKIHRPGQYVLKDLYIKSKISNKEKDIRNIFSDLQIYEGLFTNTLYGHIVVEDAVGLIEGFPIIGDETITIRFTTSDNGDYKTFEKTFDIYKVSNLLVSIDKKQYALHFASPELLINKETRLNKSYSGFTHDIVKTILTQTMGVDSSKLATWDNTKHTRNFIAPNWDPFKVINHLVKTSVSANNTADMVFFENKNGYNLTSINALIAAGSKETFRVEFDNNNTNSLDMSRIISYGADRLFDVQQNTLEAMYGSTLVIHDILTKEIRTLEYNYLDQFQEFKHLDGLKAVALCDPIKDISPKSKVFVMSNNYDQEHVDEWRQQRQSRMLQLNNYIHTLVVYGSTNRTVGDVVTFEIPSTLATRIGEQKDKYLSGEFLLTHIKHNLSTDQYTQVIELKKDAFKKEPE